ncbi:MAG: hypothetical protein ACXIUZ_00670 [Lysobacteraceae bacterium]
MKMKLALSIAASLVLAGCASTGTGSPFASSGNTDRAGIARGAGIGCLAGGGVALITGRRDLATRACVAGAVAGGVVAYRQQLSAARDLAAEAEQAGASAEVTTRTVEATDDRGQPVQEEALEQLVIDLDPADASSQGERTTRILDRAAAMADASRTPVVIRVEGSRADRDWMTQRLRAGLSAQTTATVVERVGDSPRLVLSPIPDVR